jgi:hypothetical protein
MKCQFSESLRENLESSSPLPWLPCTDASKGLDRLRADVIKHDPFSLLLT